MTTAIVKADSAYLLSADERARCLAHLSAGYSPAVSYRTLWPRGGAPLAFGDFLAQYADAIVASTSSTANAWRVGLSPELRQRQLELDASARELRSALEKLAAPIDPGLDDEARDALNSEKYNIVWHYGKAPAIVAALVAITRELRAIRAGQLADAAAIVGMLAANAGARSAE